MPFSFKLRRGYTTISMQFVGCFVMFFLLLTACSGNTASSSGSLHAETPVVAPPNDLNTSGTLTIGTDPTYPPQEFINITNGQPTGFDIDLITAIAQRMGLKAKFVPTSFDAIIDSLVARRFDVIISAVSITPKRQARVDFVSYLNVGESLLVKKGNPKNIKSTKDLCGLLVGVQLGTKSQDSLEKASNDCKTAGKPAIVLVILQSQTEVLHSLATSRVDAIYQDSSVTDNYVKQYPGQFEVGGSQNNVGLEGIVVRKGDSSMLNAIQAAFNAVKANGTYHSLILKWGLVNEEIP